MGTRKRVRLSDPSLVAFDIWEDDDGSQSIMMKSSGGGDTPAGTTIDDGADEAQGATTDPESPSGNGSVISILKRLRTLATDTLANLGALADAESASGNGSVIALLKRLRTLLDGSAHSTITWTIGLGASLSDGVALGSSSLLRLDMPAAWDTASLTFQISYDNITYRNLFWDDGSEYVVVVAASRSVMIDATAMLNARFLKIRSGTSTSPVTQTAARSVIGVVRVL